MREAKLTAGSRDLFDWLIVAHATACRGELQFDGLTAEAGSGTPRRAPRHYLAQLANVVQLHQICSAGAADRLAGDKHHRVAHA